MANISRFRTVFTGVAGAPWYSNMYFQGGTPEGAAYGPFVAAFWDGCASSMVNDVSWTVEATYAQIDSATGNITDLGDWAGDTGVGLSTEEPLPWANQAIVNWHTSTYVAGRELRGKTFVPALIQSANNNGVLHGTIQADILAAANALLDSANGAMTIWSRTHFQEHTVQSANVPLKIGVLRSRRD